MHAAQPKFGYLEAFSEDDIAYFRAMPFSLAIPSHGVLVVHAGIVPNIPLEQQRLIDLINVRDYQITPFSSCPLLTPLHARGLRHQQASVVKIVTNQVKRIASA